MFVNEIDSVKFRDLNFLHLKTKNSVEYELLTKEILCDDFTVGHSHQRSQRKVVNRNVVTVEQ
jgi:hypothetical protein